MRALTTPNSERVSTRRLHSSSTRGTWWSLAACLYIIVLSHKWNVLKLKIHSLEFTITRGGYLCFFLGFFFFALGFFVSTSWSSRNDAGAFLGVSLPGTPGAL
jgi:hypothetical protein